MTVAVGQGVGNDGSVKVRTAGSRVKAGSSTQSLGHA